MCNHTNISILPTEENTWGIANTYTLKCADCKKILLYSESPCMVKKYISTHEIEMIHGQKYID